jgi:hypothetical protein
MPDFKDTPRPGTHCYYVVDWITTEPSYSQKLKTYLEQYREDSNQLVAILKGWNAFSTLGECSTCVLDRRQLPRIRPFVERMIVEDFLDSYQETDTLYVCEFGCSRA